MVASDSFTEFLREQLAPVGRVTMRRMFGKTGVFCDGLMLGMVTENTLYFRVDDLNRATFKEAESFPPLSYKKQGSNIDLSFWRAPERLFGEPDEPVLEGWTVLAALAAVTSRIRLATLCTAVSYRNPAHLAKIAATIDLISRGRLTLGIGAGFFEDEYKQYGWEFPPRPATRIRQMEEAVRLILQMWTEPRTTFHGRYFRVEDAILEPKPMQKPRPPVLIAGDGEQMTLRAVAYLADGCNIVRGDIAEVRPKLAV